MKIKEKFIGSEIATDQELSDAIATKVFGNNFQVVESVGESSNTSLTVYAIKLSLTTEDLPLGDYTVTANYKYRSSTNRAATIRIMDGNTEIKNDEPSVASGIDYSARSMRAILTQVSGVRTITLEFKAGNSLNSSTANAIISQASLTLWRIK